ncbi:MAG: hypothetical protein AB1782_19860 [Cyanobacteriota bacterium]
MTNDGDILSKFKLLSETTVREQITQKPQEQRTLDIFEGFMQDKEDPTSDLFGSFLRRSTDTKDKKANQLLNIAETIDRDKEKGKETHKDQEQKSQKFNFLQKAFNKILNKTNVDVSNQAGKFVSKEEDKDSVKRKSAFSSFDGKFDPGKSILADSTELNITSLYGRQQKVNAENSSLLSKVAKISVNYNTDNMEDIIKSEELSKNDLFELFVNYVKKSVEEKPETGKVLGDVLSKANVDGDLSAAHKKSIDRVKLENIFIDFIKGTSGDAKSSPLDNAMIASNSVIVEFAAAINPEYMTRDELEELFVRFCRLVSVKFPSAFKDLQTILDNALPVAFVPDDGSAMKSKSVVDNFRSAISPEYMTRDELEEIFIRYVRELSINAPGAWSDMQGVLSNAISLAFEPDFTMDDESRGAIAGFRMAISPENMTRDELEEIFIRFSRLVSAKFPAAWAEMLGSLSFAISNAFIPDISMDDASRSAIAGFQLVIKPEFMKRDQLEELFIRFSREISVQFPQALAELQSILNQAIPNAYVEPIPDMDNFSASVIESFEAAIRPENMTREELEIVFVKFIGQLSAKFPKAHDLIRSLLSVAIANSFEPDTTMDDSSRSAIAGFAQVIKPEYMTRDELEEVFIRFSREISVKFPAAWAELQGILNAALTQAFEPDITMDDSSRSAIAGFAQAIKPEYMTRDTLEEIFIRFSREISVKFPAAWAELQGILNAALPHAFRIDTTMDDSSRSAIAGFSQAIKPEYMTRDELEELFLRFSREVSVRFPAAWAELQGMLSVAVANAFVPDTTMDDSSRSAIAGFAQAIKPEYMTRDTLEEIFIRFSREISIKFPAAWAELQGILNLALPQAFQPDTTMDDSSRSAIAGFSQVVKPEYMTRDELEELFLRFSREVSIRFPAAWAELQGMLTVAVANAFVLDTTMDDSSRAAIAGFEQTIKPEFMTRDQLEEAFVRFSREVSIRFPAAWAELQGLLNKALPEAFVPDTSMDDSSRAAIAGFEQAIKPDYMTRVELETLFIRFTREISISFPAAWDQLQGVLNTALPHAFVPDNSMDNDTKALIDEFQSIVNNREFTENELEDLFADYMRQVPLRFPVVKSIIENTSKSKRGDAEAKDKLSDQVEKDFYSINNEFKNISNISNELNIKAQEITKDLKAATSKEDAKIHIDRLNKIQASKSSLDKQYGASRVDMDSNIKATQEIKDDYIQRLALSYDKKDDRELFEIDTEKLSNWDMLRMLRREEVLDVMYDLPKEDLIESLYVVPKHLLKQALVQLPVEEMCKVLLNARFPEALLRSMPRSKAIELLPSADEMLPILMNMGNISGFRNGCDLLEDVIMNSLKVEPEQNPTRTQEEILPFVMEQLIGKTPRFADAVRPVQGKQSPIQAALADIEAKPESMDKQFINMDKKLEAEGELDKFRKMEPELQEKYDKAKSKSFDNQIASRADIDEDPDSLREQFEKGKKLEAEDELLKRTPVKESNTDEKQKLELKYRRPESLEPKQLENLAKDTMKNFSDKESQEVLAAKRGTPAQMLEFLELLKEVKDLASAKMAVSVLSVAQQKAVAKAALPMLETKHIVKISQNYGTSKTDMVKQMPRYSIEGLIKDLPKHYMIQGFKLLDKSMVIGMLKTQPSQTIARVASEMLSRDTVKDTAFKKKGFV